MWIRAEAFVIAALLCAATLIIENTNAATLFVNRTGDGGPGSLRDALAAASDGDTIDASSVSGTITLTRGELLVTKSVTILGPGLSSLALNGSASSRVFHIQNAGSVTISGLTISNGATVGGFVGSAAGGVYNDHSNLTLSRCAIRGNSADHGAGLCNDGSSGGSATLSVVDCIIAENSATTQGGGIYNTGAFSGSAAVTILSSTISGNSSGASDGGGIFNNGKNAGSANLLIVNSTFSGNVARLNGGGIYNDCSIGGAGAVQIAHSTLKGNSAGKGWSGGIIYNNGGGGVATVEIGDTILDAGDFGGTIFNRNGSVVSQGHNLSSDGNGPNDDSTDLRNTDPRLGPLQDNGGNTPTHALMPGSPAVDAGDPSYQPGNFDPPMSSDQRGFDRVVNGRIDIGALESQTGPGPTPGPRLEVYISVSPRSISHGGDALFRVSSVHGPASQPVTIFCSMSGSAVYGTDYNLSGVFGQVTIPTGQSSATVTLHAIVGGQTRRKTAIMTLTSGAGYNVSTLRRSAKVTIKRR